MDATFCAKCGSQMGEAAAFCTRCGSAAVAAPPKADVAVMPKPGPSRAAKIGTGILFAVLGLVLIDYIFGSGSGDQQAAEACKQAASTEAIRTVVQDQLAYGMRISSLAFDGQKLSVSLNTGEWLSDSQTEIRMRMGQSLKPLREVSRCFTAVQTIDADIMAPAATQRDEHGAVAPSGEGMVASLDIDRADLGRYPDDFDWDLYSVYVANRYVHLVNFNLRDHWNAEVAEETKMGGFTAAQ